MNKDARANLDRQERRLIETITLVRNDYREAAKDFLIEEGVTGELLEHLLSEWAHVVATDALIKKLTKYCNIRKKRDSYD